MKFWKKLRIGLRLVAELTMLSTMWPTVKPTLKSWLDELERKAEEHQAVGEFYAGLKRVVDLIESL